MAIALGRNDDEPVMEMNTTPLIDVMLVLLVMFIITIPLQSHAVKVPLPGPTPPFETKMPDAVINKLTISARGAVKWNGATVDLVTLRRYLDGTKAMIPEPELHIQPTPDARYDIVDQVLAVVKKSEITKLGFVGNEQYSVWGKN
jgi:biopolymer transport protein ExbD